MHIDEFFFLTWEHLHLIFIFFSSAKRTQLYLSTSSSVIIANED